MSLALLFQIAAGGGGGGPDPASAWARWDNALLAGYEFRTGPERAFQIVPGATGTVLYNVASGTTFDFAGSTVTAGGLLITGDQRLGNALKAMGAFTEVSVPSR